MNIQKLKTVISGAHFITSRFLAGKGRPGPGYALPLIVASLHAVTLFGCLTEFHYPDDAEDSPRNNYDDDQNEPSEDDFGSTPTDTGTQTPGLVTDSDGVGPHPDTTEPESASGANDTGEPEDTSELEDTTHVEDTTEPEDTTAPENTDAEEAITITHSTSQNVLENHSLACITEEGGPHLRNSYYRVFNLADFGITSDFHVTRVEIGIQTARASYLGVQPATVKLHTLQGPFTKLSNLQRLKTANVFIKNKNTAIERIPIKATAPAGSTLVVEFFMPDGSEMGNILRVGCNGAGETSPTYLVSPNCDLNVPTPIAEIGKELPFPVNMVMNVIGTHEP